MLQYLIVNRKSIDTLLMNILYTECDSSSTRWLGEYTNARNGGSEKEQMKSKRKMGEGQHRYVWYNGNSK